METVYWKIKPKGVTSIKTIIMKELTIIIPDDSAELVMELMEKSGGSIDKEIGVVHSSVVAPHGFIVVTFLPFQML